MPKVKAKYYAAISFLLMTAFIALFYAAIWIDSPFESLSQKYLGFSNDPYILSIMIWWFSSLAIFVLLLFYGFWLISLPEYKDKDKKVLLWLGAATNFLMTFFLTFFTFFGGLEPAVF